MTRLANSRETVSPASFPLMAMSVIKRPAAPVKLEAANDRGPAAQSLLVRRRRRNNRRNAH